MKIKLANVLGSFLLILFLSSCSPSVLDVTLYTTDIEAANEGEVFEVPVRASFTMYSDDDGELETASAIAEKYLAPDSVFCLLYTSPSPRDATLSRMPSSA